MTTFSLKILACIFMFLDHLGFALFQAGILTGSSGIYLTLRIIGRLAFPIFGFQLARGAVYTKNKGKYLFRLFLFALFSEIPFNLLTAKSFWSTGHQNVCFTLLIGLFCIYSMMWADGLQGKKRVAGGILVGILVAVGCVAAYIFRTDYDYAGVLMIVLMGMSNLKLEKIRKKIPDAGYLQFLFTVLGIFVCSLICGNVEWYSLLALLPLYYYNGRRGRYNRHFKWAVYAFYPVHLLIFSLVFILPVMK